jgi:hypothetical protein
MRNNAEDGQEDEKKKRKTRMKKKFLPMKTWIKTNMKAKRFDFWHYFREKRVYFCRI